MPRSTPSRPTAAMLPICFDVIYPSAIPFPKTSKLGSKSLSNAAQLDVIETHPSTELEKWSHKFMLPDLLYIEQRIKLSQAFVDWKYANRVNQHVHGYLEYLVFIASRNSLSLSQRAITAYPFRPPREYTASFSFPRSFSPSFFPSGSFSLSLSSYLSFPSPSLRRISTFSPSHFYSNSLGSSSACVGTPSPPVTGAFLLFTRSPLVLLFSLPRFP